MFTAKKGMDVNLDKVDTLIGTGTEFKGTLIAKGTLRVDGKVDGKIIAQGDVVVGNDGVIEADIEARNVSISGVVRGNVIASAALELMPTAKLFGDIQVKSLQITEGALFEGQSKMLSDESTVNQTKKNQA